MKIKLAVRQVCLGWICCPDFYFLIISDLEDEDDWSVNDEPQVTVWLFSLLFFYQCGIF